MAIIVGILGVIFTAIVAVVVSCCMVSGKISKMEELESERD